MSCPRCDNATICSSVSGSWFLEIVDEAVQILYCPFCGMRLDFGVLDALPNGWKR